MDLHHEFSKIEMFHVLLDLIIFQCAQIIKNTMDEKYGGAGYWNVVVGESFDVS